jgi:putative component of membrane protein insertase Oxa1/YidC/SpoIIIJ protein YidD
MTGSRCISLVFCLLLFGNLFAQQALQKWGKGTVHYTDQPAVQAENRQNDGGLLKSVMWFYHVGISEADGEHCPFNPTCSHFFLVAVHETNFFQGLCMFMDRFTRDSYPLNREKNYPFDPVTRHFNDPVEKYILK